MKFLLFCLIFFSLEHSIASIDTLLVVKKPNATSCNDYFIVSKKLEPDSLMRIHLQSYLYESLVDVLSCSVDSIARNELFERKSFAATILLFYKDLSYEKLNHLEQVSQWREGYDNLLRNCSNRKILYRIVKELLDLDKSNGLIVLWERLDIEQLPNFKSYVKRVIGNKSRYKCAELAVIFHNLGRYRDRDKMMTVLKKNKTSGVLIQNLEDSFKKSKKISYEEYVQKIFGGY